MKTPVSHSAHPTHSAHSGRHMLDGTLWILLAEGLILPTGLISAALLTRRLGAADYGLFTLAVVVVSWIEWSVTSLFSRTTVKFVSEAEDWRPIGSAVLRLYLLACSGAALLLCMLAVPVAKLLNEPVLASYLWLFAIDIPLFGLAYAHRHILIGLGSFRQRAIASAGRWISRLLFIIVFIEAGLSVTGAIMGSIGASFVELAISRWYVRPALFGHSTFPARRLWGYAVPLFLFALSMRLFDKLDLFTLKALGGTAAAAGIYGAAQNIALAPGLFALSFSPLLLSNLGRMLRAHKSDEARMMSRNAMRAVVLLLPFAGMTAGAAPELIEVIFGQAFLPAAPLLALLIFGAIAAVMISVATTILTAAGKPNWTAILTVPLPLAAVAGHFILIPYWGATGASLVTTLLAGLGALAAVLCVHHHWGVWPPAATLWRSLLVSVMAYGASYFWTASGFLLLLKLPAICILIVVTLAFLREFNAWEIALAKSLLRTRASAAPSPHKV